MSPTDPIAEARRQWVSHELEAPDVMAAVTSVFRVHQLLLGRLNELLAPFQLTFARYELLQLLAFSRRGELPLSVVASRLQVHAASVTNAVARLEQAGLVARAPHPEDGRAVLATITDAGRRQAAEATSVLTTARFGADGLDDVDAQAVATLLTPLRAAAGDLD